MGDIKIIAVVTVLAGAAIWLYQHGKDVQVGNQAQGAIVAVEKRNDIEKKVIRLSDPDLDLRLARWMRD